MDGGVLAAGMMSDNPERSRTLLAAVAVAPVVALDLLYALLQEAERPESVARSRLDLYDWLRIET